MVKRKRGTIHRYTGTTQRRDAFGRWTALTRRPKVLGRSRRRKGAR